jgi:hypothetical protein
MESTAFEVCGPPVWPVLSSSTLRSSEVIRSRRADAACCRSSRLNVVDRLGLVQPGLGDCHIFPPFWSRPPSPLDVDLPAVTLSAIVSTEYFPIPVSWVDLDCRSSRLRCKPGLRRLTGTRIAYAGQVNSRRIFCWLTQSAEQPHERETRMRNMKVRGQNNHPRKLGELRY